MGAFPFEATGELGPHAFLFPARAPTNLHVHFLKVGVHGEGEKRVLAIGRNFALRPRCLAFCGIGFRPVRGSLHHGFIGRVWSLDDGLGRRLLGSNPSSLIRVVRTASRFFRSTAGPKERRVPLAQQEEAQLHDGRSKNGPDKKMFWTVLFPRLRNQFVVGHHRHDAPHKGKRTTHHEGRQNRA